MSLALSFAIALSPLIIILVGIAFFKQSGLRMGIIGWLVAVGLAVTYFRTDIWVALAGSAFGFLKSFGISISVIATMYMIFLMKEVGALESVSSKIKKLVRGKELQALYIGIGFGSFLTSLGVVTPSLFPPLLLVMGFPPAQAVAIAVLGYNATTSFALLSIPITLPAELFHINLLEFTFKITLFLPVVSVAISLAILWLVGGRESVKRGLVPGMIAGLVLALSCVAFAAVDYYSGVEIIPVRVMGVFAGLICMGSLQIYDRFFYKPKEAETKGAKEETAKPEQTKDAAREREGSNSADEADKKSILPKPAQQKPMMPLLTAISPWIILTILAIVVSVPQISVKLTDAPGTMEQIVFYKNGTVDNKTVSAQIVDFNFLSVIYTWITISIVISILFLRPSKKQLKSVTILWAKRSWAPFLAYSIYFSIAYVMAWSSCMEVADRILVQSSEFNEYNMNFILGAGLAAAFGMGYIYVAGALGMLGAVIGGSEASSNVMFYRIQEKATADIGINTGGNSKEFMTIYGAHATAGGVASAITPAKINNAVVTINAGPEVETQIMRKHIVIVMLITIAIGIMTGIFVGLAI